MLLYLKVKPLQRSDKIEQTPEGWQVRLKAPAVEGKANENLINYLSDVLDLPKSAILIKKGLTNKFKCLEINQEEEIVIKVLDAESKK